ncbi:MAG TPA: hydroxymethylbilane synthase [Ktedonosporobacter sp.]|nr:hydroxymethylbilane synthase [Ktedonosporobacter sp.]
MIQTRWVAEQLRQQWPSLEIVIEQIRTTGDHITDVPLSQIGGDGVFVTEIERALQERRIDLAVHSLKDLPTTQPVGMRVIVAGPREDVRDVLVSNRPIDGEGGDEERGILRASLLGGKEEHRIGTGSLRRAAQIRRLWPTAQILPLRGNVDTRLRKLEAGEYDAIVLAAAGLHRMDLQERLADRLVYLPVLSMLPAPGQGALGVEIRDEPEFHALLAPLQNIEAQAATCAERAFMRRLGAGCYLPVAAYAHIVGDEFVLHGLVISLDGQRHASAFQRILWQPDCGIEQAEQLGVNVAEQALAEGADAIIQELDITREQEHQRV